jgi:hypothetical protein
MYRLPLTVSVLFALGGCAASQPSLQASFAAGSAAPPDVSPVQTLEIGDYADNTICEKVTRPGSRIVIGETCYQRDRSEALEEHRYEVVQAQINELRREQEMLEMWQRQRDLEMQRAAMRRALMQ